jgi:AcrR family transcriptional regulator
MARGTRTRLEPAARRAQLVALGVEMLSSRPLDQVAVDDIAAEAGISRGLLFHYFPTKRDFHAAVVQAAADDLVERTNVDAGLPLPQQLRAAVEGFLDYVAANRAAYVALLRGAGGGGPELREVLDATRARVATRLLDRLGVSEPFPARLWLVARGWVAFSEEVSVGWLDRDDIDRDEVVELLVGSLSELSEFAALAQSQRSG